MKARALSVAALFLLAAARPAVSQFAFNAESPYQAALDAHFLDSTEYLIASEELHWTGEYVAVGLQLAVPSTSLRGGMQFLVEGAGSGWRAGDRAWTNQFYRTRIATRADLEVGKLVFCFNQTDNGVYRAPRNRAEALNGGWFATTITDVSTIDRNEVRAGRARLSISCLRVLE